MLDALRPRGDTEEVSLGDGLLAGTQRLRIVDPERAGQPWISADQRWLLCYNGEIFNHRELRDELRRLGRKFRSESDTEVVVEAFGQWGTDAVRRLRGEFAFAITERSSGRTYLARDPLGVKPLYWSASAGCLHVAAVVRTALRDSIAVRVDTGLPVGVILSGGLDSSLTLLHTHAIHPDCVAFTVGAPGSEDLAYARRLTADLGVRHEVIEISPRAIRLAEIREAIRVSELTEYGDIINAVVSVPLFRRVASLGIRVVLTGDGSDELFGGYPMYGQVGQEQVRRLFRHKLGNLHRTELQRVDRTSMASGVEARVPFLDPAVVSVAMRLPMELKVRAGTEKWILRQAFADLLPDYIRQRPKNPMSHASGLHERARLYKPAFARIHRSFGYDRHEPVRRDFSVLLGQCGNELDLAIARASDGSDYSPREHVRDLAGAVRWNVRSLAGSAAGVGRGRPRAAS